MPSLAGNVRRTGRDFPSIPGLIPDLYRTCAGPAPEPASMAQQTGIFNISGKIQENTYAFGRQPENK